MRSAPENQARAARAVARFGAPSNVVEAVRKQAATEVVFMGQPPLRIDLLVTLDGVDVHDAFERAVPAEWDGHPVRVIGIDDLIANKRAAGRPQDLVAAASGARRAEERPRPEEERGEPSAAPREPSWRPVRSARCESANAAHRA